VNVVLLLPTVLALSLPGAPRSASLLPETAWALAATPEPASESTPLVESAPAQASPDEAPPAAVQADLPGPLLVKDVQPWRVWAGAITGGVFALGAPVATFAFLRANPSLVPSGWTEGLFVLLGTPVLAAWLAGPLAASLAMGAWPVAGRVFMHAVVGLAIGLASTVIPGLGILTCLVGPTVGAVYAVATSPADAFAPPVRASGPSAPGPLLSFSF